MNKRSYKPHNLEKFDPNQVWETLAARKKGDIYPTAVVSEAINFRIVHDKKVDVEYNSLLSPPVILSNSTKGEMCFLLSAHNRVSKLMLPHLPSFSVFASVKSLDDIKFSEFSLEQLNLELPLRTDEPVLENHKLVSSNYHGKGISAQSVQTWKTEFYELTDYAITKYLTEPKQLTRIERDKLSRYAELFKVLSLPSVIPIYKAINPDWFKWLDSVFQPQIELGKGEGNNDKKVVSPSYYTVNDRPVKMIPTPEGGRDVLALNMATGKFERDMSYLSRCFDPSQDVDKLSEEQFEQYVENIRLSST